MGMVPEAAKSLEATGSKDNLSGFPKNEWTTLCKRKKKQDANKENPGFPVIALCRSSDVSDRLCVGARRRDG